jgi:hypothetical protein
MSLQVRNELGSLLRKAGAIWIWSDGSIKWYLHMH